MGMFLKCLRCCPPSARRKGEAVAFRHLVVLCVHYEIQAAGRDGLVQRGSCCVFTCWSFFLHLVNSLVSYILIIL